jgi:hypothetical protein
MVRLSTVGAVLEVIEGVAAPVVTVTVAVGFAAKGAALGDPQPFRASRPLAANKTAMRYLMIPPGGNDATRRLTGVNRAIGHQSRGKNGRGQWLAHRSRSPAFCAGAKATDCR